MEKAWSRKILVPQSNAPMRMVGNDSKKRLNSDYRLKMRLWAFAAALTLASCFMFGDCAFDFPDDPYDTSTLWPWVNDGGGIGLVNQRVALQEVKINKTSVSKLSFSWEFITGYDVTATPSIAQGVVYFPDWGGSVYAVEQATGHLIWEKNLTQLTSGVLTFVKTNVSMFIPQVMISRSTPTVAGDLLVVTLYGPAGVLALNRSTGDLVWAKQLSSHPYAVMTMSGTAFEGAYYIGTSSLEEGIVGIVCCTFQGAFFKLDLKTGDIMWKVPMLPDNRGQTGLYAGVAVWGSSPSIDVDRRLVFIATGNVYTTPPAVDACEQKYRNQTNPPFPDHCLPVDDREESILAIALDDGTVFWSKHLGGYDSFNYACSGVPRPTNCPAVIGPDFDFGECPMLLRIHAHDRSWRDILVTGQKSGFIWALDHYTGELLWVTAAGPGGYIGGSSWGMTTDGERVFTNIINNLGKNFTLLPSNVVTTSAGWVAMNASTGEILWSTANPLMSTNNAPLTHANGVVFGGSLAPGHVVALDAITGKVLWTYATPGDLFGGVSVTDGCVFVPVGVSLIGLNNDLNHTHGKSVLSLCV
ncbi:unnamed protein product [Calypogeia fissa]